MQQKIKEDLRRLQMLAHPTQQTIYPKPFCGKSLRNAARTLWTTREHESILAGPAETGKTMACCLLAHELLKLFPGAQGVMCRKTYASVVGSAVSTYKRVIGWPDTPVKPYGGEKPEWFDYPNGSRLWIVGLDNPNKALSTERDFFYVNQAEELSLDDWQTLTTRCTGRGAVMPYTRIFGDANPGPPTHWIRQRENLLLLESRHEDNPTLYDDAGQLTAQGVRSLEVLDKLTGVKKQRLRHGKWVGVEGQVYEAWDRAVHLIPAFPIPAHWTRFRAIDFGYTNPFCCLWGAEDEDGRLYIYRQLYHTQQLVRQHAARIKQLSAGETYRFTVSDHDAEDRATLHDCGISTRAAWKDVSPGIEAVQLRLPVQDDGRPRLYVLEGSLAEEDVDESLRGRGKPYRLDQEFDVYSYEEGKDGKPMKEMPRKLFDHGMDALRYLVCQLDGIAIPEKVVTGAGWAKASPNRSSSNPFLRA